MVRSPPTRTITSVAGTAPGKRIEILIDDHYWVRGTVSCSERAEKFEGWLALLSILEQVMTPGRTVRPLNNKESWG